MIEGSTIGEVLAHDAVGQDRADAPGETQVDAAIKSDRLKPNEAMKLLADYERGLQGYTYLSLNGANTPPATAASLPSSADTTASA